ncbi:MAG TPA: hypothetical protein VLM42_09070, partial [Bryobacteraceae bacterium]|nr:hypothetical protein [Bryobacteraceae bacterium]
MTGLLFLALLAQNFEQRGFIENQTLFYPQTAPNDSAQVIDQAAIRWEASYKLTPWLKLNGSLDALADTHQQVNRSASLNLDDRTIQRPALSLREFSATIHKGKVTAEIGRQIIRWGKTGILTPTDRFAPKDYLSSV